MQKEQSNFGDAASASLGKHSSTDESFGIQGVYHAICYDKDGNIKWEDTAPNLVTAVGKQALFDYYFGATGTGWLRILGLKLVVLMPLRIQVIVNLLHGLLRLLLVQLPQT